MGLTVKQKQQLRKLGIDENQPLEDILSNAINLADWLYEELEIKEQDRLKIELIRLQKPTN